MNSWKGYILAKQILSFYYFEAEIFKNGVFTTILHWRLCERRPMSALLYTYKRNCCALEVHFQSANSKIYWGKGFCAHNRAQSTDIVYWKSREKLDHYRLGRLKGSFIFYKATERLLFFFRKNRVHFWEVVLADCTLGCIYIQTQS